MACLNVLIPSVAFCLLFSFSSGDMLILVIIIQSRLLLLHSIFFLLSFWDVVFFSSQWLDLLGT
jgi:hypothetical protein